MKETRSFCIFLFCLFKKIKFYIENDKNVQQTFCFVSLDTKYKIVFELKIKKSETKFFLE